MAKKAKSRSQRLDAAVEPLGLARTTCEVLGEAVGEGTNWLTLHTDLESVEGAIEGAKTDIEELKEELENWLEGMPDNLQGGMKAEQLQEAIDGLDTKISDLEDLESQISDLPDPITEDTKNDAVTALDEMVSKLDELTCPDIMFPGMF
jgi:DNA repair exonuclease SbcCD ATPase subunit